MPESRRRRDELNSHCHFTSHSSFSSLPSSIVSVGVMSGPSQLPTPAKSHFRTDSTELDAPGPSFEHVEPDVGGSEDAVHFCLLAEFDIDAGATLAHQYPYPTGTDEQ